MLDQSMFDHLYRYCYSLTVNEDDACDLLQNAFEKYLHFRGNLAEVNKFYMMRIIRNQFIDDWRKNGRIESESFDDTQHLDFSIATLEQIIIDQDMVARLWINFKPIEREILFLWAVEGYTTAEVAEWLDLPKGTVLSHISRLRKRVVNQVDQGVSRCMDH